MALKPKESAHFSCDVALEEFHNLTESPEVYLAYVLFGLCFFLYYFICYCSFTENKSLIDGVRNSLKRSYDFTKSEESPSKKSNALPELIVENFDLEQIWQQIELQNEDLLDRNITTISRVLTNKNLLFKNIELPEDDDNPEVAEMPEEDSEEEKENEDDQKDFSGSDEDDEENNESSNKVDLKRKERKSIVDDEFFKLEEMEAFLNKEEKALTEDKNKKLDDDSDSEESEGSVDYFKDDASDDDENEDDRSKNPRYKDFFVASNPEPKQKRNKFLEELGDSENDDGELKSSLELREERLKRKIEDLEEQALNEKPWQLKGEITADKRPQNSLLEEIVDFDLSARPGKSTLFIFETRF